MTDTLTASLKWCRYDDDFKDKNGYRLPADPYWLAPPQGSIVPLWHRGGAPNYQPKPMICKHVQDPIKAWRREKLKGHAGAQIAKPLAVVKNPTAVDAEKISETGTTTHEPEVFLRRNSLQYFHRVQKETQGPENEIGTVPVTQQTENFLRRNSLQLCQRNQEEAPLPADGTRSLLIFFCSAGTIAEKLANKLHRLLNRLVKDSIDLQLCTRPEPLNSLKASDLTVNNILFLIVSSTGEGEIPSNGLGLSELCESILSGRLIDRNQSFKFAVFGNGDSRYSATYNGAAAKINNYLMQVGGYPLAAGIFQADTAVDPLPLSALKTWLTKIQPTIINQPIESLATAVVRSPSDDKHTAVFVKVTPIVEVDQKYEDYQDRLLSTLGEASLVGISPGMREDKSLLVTLDVNNHDFKEMSCVQILPSNAPSKVNQALRWLCVESSDRVNLSLVDRENPTYFSFLTDYVDLELPFSDAECLEAVELASYRGLTKASLSKVSVQKVLEHLHSSIVQMSDVQRCEFIHDLFQDMPLLHTRTYSLASSQHYTPSRHRTNVSTGREIDIMVKVTPGGRFSDIFLNDWTPPAPLRCRIVDSPCGALLRQNHQKPFVVVATGAGFGPVRSLLQWRIAIVRDGLAAGRPPLLPRHRGSGISLFLGLKPADMESILDVLNEAMALNLIDVLDIVLSNPAKRRIYDDLRRSASQMRHKLFKREGMVFVCTNKAAATNTKRMFENIFGGRMSEMLGERYVEEVF